MTCAVDYLVNDIYGMYVVIFRSFCLPVSWSFCKMFVNCVCFFFYAGNSFKIKQAAQLQQVTVTSSSANITYTSCKRSVARRIKVLLTPETPETVVTMHVFN